MAYKVFISHSTRNQGLVISLANLLSRFGVEVFVAEWYLTPGERLNEKICKQIEQSDCIVALLTQNGIRTNWMQEEIRHAVRFKKIVIPLVERGVTTKDLPSLGDRKHIIEYDPHQPQQALIKASSYIKTLELKKEDREKTLLIMGGIIAFLLLLFGGKD